MVEGQSRFSCAKCGLLLDEYDQASMWLSSSGHFHCNACLVEPSYPSSVYPIDGAVLWSMPRQPTGRPSHRLLYLAYPDCPECQGVPQAECETCDQRFINQDDRVEWGIRCRELDQEGWSTDEIIKELEGLSYKIRFEPYVTQ